MVFTLAMVKYPRIWKRAQTEIDAFVGTDRLPEFDDRSSLPYVDAIVRETMRWQPPAPLCATMNTIFQTSLLIILKQFHTPQQPVISTTASSFLKVFQIYSRDLLIMTLFDRGHCLWKRLVWSRRPLTVWA
jgi:hypothetical protein